MQYQLITDNDGLARYCASASTADYLAVDTEFVRTRTLYPLLGLVQLYDGKDIALVDVTCIDALQPLSELLTNPDVVKVLHSCSEDLEAFYRHLGVLPAPLFDSQIAAGLVGMGTSLGYAKLVETMLEVSLDKGESRTDWLARPLSAKQLHYAANDVLYLYQLYPALRAAADAKGVSQWVMVDTAFMGEKRIQPVQPELAYLRFKNAAKLRGKSLAALKLLAAWRVKMAQQRNLALNFVVREANLLAIAQSLPASKQALHGIQGLSPQEIRKHGADLLDIIASVEAMEPEYYPPRMPRLVDNPEYKRLSKDIRDLCQRKGDELAIPVEMIGSKSQVNQLLSWHWFELDETRQMGRLPDLLSTWRGDVLRQGLSELLGRPLPDSAA